jgi:activating signal cointegrator complex subunit 2
MKADIIRRAEELSDEEDEAAGKPRGRTVTFEEELDDDVESLVDKGVKVAGDGEGSDESDDEGDAADVSSIICCQRDS